MELALQAKEYQASEGQSDPEALVARIQDETLATRKKLASELIDTSSNSSTAAFACAAGVALVTATNITAGMGDFLTRQLTDVIVGTVPAFNNWDIRSYFADDPSRLALSQSSKHTTSHTTTSDLISYIRNHLRSIYASDLANQLDYLREASIEEAPEQSPISAASLQGFISFMQIEGDLAKPDLVLTYTGNIRAEWHKSRKEHFAAEFLPTGQVRYVVFASDPSHPSRTDRTQGLVSADSLLDKVKPFNVLSWVAS
jgi:hypothetical protein